MAFEDVDEDLKNNYHYQTSSLSHVSGLCGFIRGHNAIDLVSPRFRLNAATYIEELHTKLLTPGSGNISKPRSGAPTGWNTSPYSKIHP
ncbi:Hypothetical protein FKW44_019437 [Caligus rogercresseyi]|uniref:Uncharacterized protein n=1 Tax=Caligus rogercresseyi TaxID=217165 RepID=A0A7T8GVV6_CALRO|nr:Hypothetical protein FKW44_019437 [Caligus rogercresseyi]